VSLVELSVTVRNCNCIVTTAFSTGDDYPYSGLPGSFHDRKRIDCYGNDNHSWLYRFTDCE
jgi:hypothetical protein